MNENYFPGRGLISFSGQGLISLFQPEAPSPAPSPAPCPAPVSQPSVIYAEPIETHNNREIIQLKEKIKSLEEENKSLKKENWEYKVRKAGKSNDEGQGEPKNEIRRNGKNNETYLRPETSHPVSFRN